MCPDRQKRAHPSDQINAYSPTLPTSAITYMSVELACTDMALFAAIAKDLTVSSFVHAGYGLKNVVFPGSGVPVAFGTGRSYALGAVYMVHYDASTKALVFSNTPAATG